MMIHRPLKKYHGISSFANCTAFGLDVVATKRQKEKQKIYAWEY